MAKGALFRVEQDVSGGITSISLPGRATLNRVNIIDIALDQITTGVACSISYSLLFFLLRPEVFDCKCPGLYTDPSPVEWPRN